MPFNYIFAAGVSAIYACCIITPATVISLLTTMLHIIPLCIVAVARVRYHPLPYMCVKSGMALFVTFQSWLFAGLSPAPLPNRQAFSHL